MVCVPIIGKRKQLGKFVKMLRQRDQEGTVFQEVVNFDSEGEGWPKCGRRTTRDDCQLQGCIRLSLHRHTNRHINKSYPPNYYFSPNVCYCFQDWWLNDAFYLCSVLRLLVGRLIGK